MFYKLFYQTRFKKYLKTNFSYILRNNIPIFEQIIFQFTNIKIINL